MLRDNLITYGWVTKISHLIMACIILVQLGLGIYLNYAPESLISSIISWHKSLGLLLLAFAVLFVIWRLVNPKPTYPFTMSSWEKIAAYFARILLYILLIAMPLSGWVMSTAAGYATSFFGLFSIATPFVSKNNQLSTLCDNLHLLFAWCLGILIIIHILAAIKHHFINRDNILQRMF